MLHPGEAASRPADPAPDGPDDTVSGGGCVTSGPARRAPDASSGDLSAALERLVAQKGVTDPATLARYQHAWDHAADRTPHGEPIELRPGDFHDHD